MFVCVRVPDESAEENTDSRGECLRQDPPLFRPRALMPLQVEKERLLFTWPPEM